MTYRSALLLFLGVFVLQFSRILFFGEVIFPHDNGVEVGSFDKETDSRISNRKFSDESSVFIPELANNLRSDRKGWMATWNPHVQLGRPAYQISGLSRAYLLTNVLSYLTSDPFQLYTALVLLIVGLTGALFLLFLRSLGLHPVAAACAAIGLALTTLVSYWLTFVMFLSAICWSTCLLWLITEFIQKRSCLLALGLAFATYSLLMTAYPQITILCLYMTGAYGLIRIAQMEAVLQTKIWMTLALLGCAVTGALASLPAYLDLLLVAENSVRLHDVADSFFLGVLPSLHRFPDFGNFVMTIFDWSWLGNAIDPKYPLTFNGLCFTPIYGSLIWLSLFLRQRGLVLFWQLLLTICFIGTISPATYLFAVHHLGFGLSRIQLLIGGIVPGFILSAVVMDSILRRELNLTIYSAIWLLLPVAAALLFVSSNWRWSAIDRIAVVITLLLIITVLAAIYFRSAVAFIVIAVLSVFLYGQPLILSRSPKRIHVSSQLVDAIKTATPNGERFAIADRIIAAAPPNQEALLGLNSVNSYDSLSPRKYLELVEHWSADGAVTYGRHFRFLDVKRALIEPAFPFSNIRVILSTHSLTTDRLTLATEVSGIKLYETVVAPIGLLQTTDFRFSGAADTVIPGPANIPSLQSHRVEILNDFQKIKVTPFRAETLLFLSQQYHRAWRAQAHHQPLRTVIVNQFYQGVIIPPFTDEVELSFRPFVLWSWIPQALFVGVGAIALLHNLIRTRRNDAVREAI